MKREDPNVHAWLEPEVEARLVASLLGEASAFEEAELQRLMKERPEVAVYYGELKAMDGLLAESTRPIADEDQWRLAPERRSKILNLLGRESAPDHQHLRHVPARRRPVQAWVGWGALAAALAVCVGLGGWWLQRSSSTTKVGSASGALSRSPAGEEKGLAQLIWAEQPEVVEFEGFVNYGFLAESDQKEKKGEDASVFAFGRASAVEDDLITSLPYFADRAGTRGGVDRDGDLGMELEAVEGPTAVTSPPARANDEVEFTSKLEGQQLLTEERERELGRDFFADGLAANGRPAAEPQSTVTMDSGSLGFASDEEPLDAPSGGRASRLGGENDRSRDPMSRQPASVSEPADGRLAMALGDLNGYGARDEALLGGALGGGAGGDTGGGGAAEGSPTTGPGGQAGASAATGYESLGSAGGFGQISGINLIGPESQIRLGREIAATDDDYGVKGNSESLWIEIGQVASQESLAQANDQTAELATLLPSPNHRWHFSQPESLNLPIEDGEALLGEPGRGGELAAKREHLVDVDAVSGIAQTFENAPALAPGQQGQSQGQQQHQEAGSGQALFGDRFEWGANRGITVPSESAEASEQGARVEREAQTALSSTTAFPALVEVEESVVATAPEDLAADRLVVDLNAPALKAPEPLAESEPDDEVKKLAAKTKAPASGSVSETFGVEALVKSRESVESSSRGRLQALENTAPAASAPEEVRRRYGEELAKHSEDGGEALGLQEGLEDSRRRGSFAEAKRRLAEAEAADDAQAAEEARLKLLDLGERYRVVDLAAMRNRASSGGDPLTGEDGAVADSKDLSELKRDMDVEEAEQKPAAEAAAERTPVAGKPTSNALVEEAPPAPPEREDHASATPFSTFSLHVSDVSFKLAKAALLEGGETPDPSQIRVEDFVNAVDYGDPAPKLAEKVACQVEQAAHPFRQQRNLLRIALRTAEMGRSAGVPLRLTLLLDTSGSMERSDRRESVLRAMEVLTSQLTPEDTVTLIGFASRPRLVQDRLTGEALRQLPQLMRTIPSGGGSNLEEALLLGAEHARRQFDASGQNRVVLVTDGAANLGDANAESLREIVVGLRQEGIAFDACGVGADGLNDTILEALTRQGDGRYYFLDWPEDADAGFARQLAGAFRPAARNVKVQVRFNERRVGHYRLIGFEKHRLKKEDFRNDRVDAAELAAAEAGVALYEVEPLPQGQGEIGEVFVRFQDTRSGEMIERSWIIPYRPSLPAWERATPSIQLAGMAAFLGETLKRSPFAAAVDFDELAEIATNLRQHYGSSPRVAELLAMIAKVREW